MRKLLYTTLAVLTLAGCSNTNEDFYEGTIISERYWQNPEGNTFYRFQVDMNTGRNPTHRIISFNVSGNCEFLEHLNRQFHSGNVVRISGKELTDSIPVLSGKVFFKEPIITPDRLTKVN